MLIGSVCKKTWEEANEVILEKELEVTALEKTFPQRGTVLKNVSFNVVRGEALGLIGGNGSGKSTLLRCCLRLIEPDSGEINLMGHRLDRLNKAALRRVRSRVGLIFQRHNLVPRLSVLTNVVHGAMGRGSGPRTWFHGSAPNEIREEAMKCLKKVGLAHLALSRANQLSGGESQRVAIARALMQRPQLMLADEPVASLDPKVGREVMELFVELTQRENITLLFISHDLDHALSYSTRVLGLKQGKLILNESSKYLTKRELRAIYG